VLEVKYLGIVLTSMLDHSMHVHRLVCDFYARSNAVLSTFSRFHRGVLQYLFEAYCCSFYGIICCSLADNNLRQLCVAWNKVIRRIFGLPFQTHTNLLPQIIGRPHIKFIIYTIFLKYAFSVFNSQNPIVLSVAQGTSIKTTTVFGGNLFHILSQFDVSVAEFSRYTRCDLMRLVIRIKHVDLPDYRTGFIRDLITNNNIDSEASRAILHYLCCS
jgi:hypothetical protein